MKQVFEEIKENLNCPSLPIKVVDGLRSEGGLEYVSEVEVSRAFMNQSHQANSFNEMRLFRFGQFHL